jgi:hypothetical protein
MANSTSRLTYRSYHIGRQICRNDGPVRWRTNHPRVPIRSLGMNRVAKKDPGVLSQTDEVLLLRSSWLGL